MIDLGELRRLAGEGPVRILVDPSGTARPATGHEETTAPALVVAEPTEALKQVEGSEVVGSLDRDTAWEVRGLVLDGAVLARIPEHVDSIRGLIEAVAAAGLSWEIVLTDPL